MLSLTVMCFSGLATGVLCHNIIGQFAVFIIIEAVIALFIPKTGFKTAIFLLMLGIGALRTDAVISYDSVIDDLSGKEVEVCCIVSDIPEIFDDSYGYTVITDSFSSGDNLINHKTHMKIYSDKYFNFGDKIKFRGVLKPYTKNKNSFAFQADKYNNTRGVFYKMSANNSEICDFKFIPNVEFMANHIKNTLFNRISAAENNNDYKNIISGVYLRYAPDAGDELYNLMTRADTWRFLFSSKIRLMVLLIIMAVLSLILPKLARDIIMLIFCAVYIALNPGSGSALRIMGTVAAGIVTVRIFGFSTFYDTLCVALIVIGLVNPLMLSDNGLLISALSCVAVKIFYKPVNAFIGRFIHVRIISRIISLAFIFLVIMAPVSAFLGFELSLYSLFIMPVFAALMLVFFIFAPLYFFIPTVFGLVIHFLCNIIIILSRAVDLLPFNVISLAVPSIVFVVMWYAFAFAVRYKKYRYLSGTVFAVFAGIYIFTFITNYNTVGVHFVSVGQGDGMLITAPHRTNIIVDGGGTSGNILHNGGEREFLPYLTGNGVRNIDAAFVSHYHDDHVKGVIAAINTVNVKTLYIPPPEPDNELYMNLISSAQKHGTEIKLIKNGDIINVDGLRMECIAAENRFKDDNENSYVYKLSFGEFETLFTGDIGFEAENDILSQNKDVSADILKVAHHASGNSSGEVFLNAVSPEIAVACLGENNSFGFPNTETVSRFEQASIPIYTTADNGNIVVKAEKTGKFSVFLN